jgi:phosphohistidine phosphatase SixA
MMADRVASMSRWTSTFFKLLLAVWVMTGVCHANASELSDALKKADHVLLMRHALAPGVGDPAGYTLQDCKTQRNLDSTGREQALRIGQWLKAQGVKDALVFSSAWCRCTHTADRLGFGTPVLEPALNSFFDDMRLGPQSNVRLQKFIANQLKIKNDKAIILVTHHVNIAEFMGENLGSGDMVLAKVTPQGKLVSFKIYSSP